MLIEVSRLLEASFFDLNLKKQLKKQTLHSTKLLISFVKLLIGFAILLSPFKKCPIDVNTNYKRGDKSLLFEKKL